MQVNDSVRFLNKCAKLASRYNGVSTIVMSNKDIPLTGSVLRNLA